MLSLSLSKPFSQTNGHQAGVVYDRIDTRLLTEDLIECLVDRRCILHIHLDHSHRNALACREAPQTLGGLRVPSVAFPHRRVHSVACSCQCLCCEFSDSAACPCNDNNRHRPASLVVPCQTVSDSTPRYSSSCMC